VSNYPLWSDPRVDAISNEWFGKPPSAQRAAAYEEAQKIIADACADHPDRPPPTAHRHRQGHDGRDHLPEMCMRYWPPQAVGGLTAPASETPDRHGSGVLPIHHPSLDGMG